MYLPIDGGFYPYFLLLLFMLIYANEICIDVYTPHLTVVLHFLYLQFCLLTFNFIEMADTKYYGVWQFQISIPKIKKTSAKPQLVSSKLCFHKGSNIHFNQLVDNFLEHHIERAAGELKILVVFLESHHMSRMKWKYMGDRGNKGH